MKPKTKHRQIVEFVLDLILDGKYKAGDRLPSDGQLVREFSTSRPTVAKAMRQLEDEGYIERRVGSGSFVLVSAQSKPSLIGLLTPEIGEAELFEPLCSEIARKCQRNGLSLLWADSSIHDDQADHHEQAAKELCDRFIRQEVTGVFFAPVEFSERMVRINREIADRLDQAGISVVLLDRDLARLPDRSPYDWVGIDNFRAGHLQTSYMIGLGCKKIAYVSRLSSAPTIDLRIAGYRYALQNAGLDASPKNVICGNVGSTEFLNELQPKNFDAIVCSNDTTASLLLNSLTKSGVRVPQDIRIIGIDDVKVAESATVPLTTVHQPFRSIGKAAVDAMIGRIENRAMKPRSIFVDVEVVVRESCGASLNLENNKNSLPVNTSSA